jgi:hypothetical protein
MNLLRVIKMLALEAFSADSLVREPEPSAAMDSAENVEAFDQQGLQEGPMMPLPLQQPCDQPIAAGGRLSARPRFRIRALARSPREGRPDVEISGLELAQPMVDLGNRMFEREGLFPRVRLEARDMTAFGTRPFDRLDAISINLALEHLEDFSAVQTLVAHVGIRSKVRMRLLAVQSHAPENARRRRALSRSDDAGGAASLQADSRNSLIASWRYSELLPVAIGARRSAPRTRVSPVAVLFGVLGGFCRSKRHGRFVARTCAAARACGPGDFAMFRALLLPDVPLDTPRQRV